MYLNLNKEKCYKAHRHFKYQSFLELRNKSGWQLCDKKALTSEQNQSQEKKRELVPLNPKETSKTRIDNPLIKDKAKRRCRTAQ